MSAGLLLQVKTSTLEIFGAEREHTMILYMHYYALLLLWITKVTRIIAPIETTLVCCGWQGDWLQLDWQQSHSTHTHHTLHHPSTSPLVRVMVVLEVVKFLTTLVLCWSQWQCSWAVLYQEPMIGTRSGAVHHLIVIQCSYNTSCVHQYHCCVLITDVSSPGSWFTPSL